MKKRTGHLYLRDGIYWLRYTVDGKRIRQSLGTRDKRKALTMRDKALAPVAAADRVDVLTAIQGQLADAETTAARLADEMNPPLPLAGAWAAYMAAQNRPDSSERTLIQYEAELRRFTAWAGEHHPEATALQDVTKETAEAYARHLTESKVSASTFNQHTGFLKLLWKVLAETARAPVNPWAGIKRKRLVSVGRRELTVDELKRVCRAAEGELRLLLALGLYLGARLGDAVFMKWANLDLHRGLVKYTPHKTARRGGRAKTLTVPLHAGLLALLMETPPDARKGFVLPGMAKLYSERGVYAVSDIVQRHFENNGMETRQDGTGRRKVNAVGFHSLRHSAVSLLREAGAPLSVTMAIVGHSTLAIHDTYSHAGEAALKSAVAALPAILGDAPAALPARPPLPAWAKDTLRALAGKLNARTAAAVKAKLKSLAE